MFLLSPLCGVPDCQSVHATRPVTNITQKEKPTWQASWQQGLRSGERVKVQYGFYFDARLEKRKSLVEDNAKICRTFKGKNSTNLKVHLKNAPRNAIANLEKFSENAEPPCPQTPPFFK